MKSTTKLGLASVLALMIALPASAKTATKPAAKASAPAAKTAASKTAVKATAAKKSSGADVKVLATIKGKKATAKPVIVAKAQKAAKVPAVRVVKATPTPVVRKVVYQKPAYQVTRTSYGRQYGLNQAYDPLDLRASVALVVDQNSWTTQYEKNSRQSLPIASITKLMTAMVTLDASLDMNEMITIDSEDAAHYASSRLSTGTTLSRRDVMLLALMSSENRAAYALGRTYPGGLYAFTQAMNAKAAMLGMSGANFVDPSGLSPSNQATAMDLAKMVNAASQYKIIRQDSTSESATVYTPSGRQLVYHNSNRLISRNMGWNIGMQKTGTLSAAGKCVVIQAVINGSPKILVLLDSSSADSRVTDAVRIKNWLESGGAGTISSTPVLTNNS